MVPVPKAFLQDLVVLLGGLVQRESLLERAEAGLAQAAEPLTITPQLANRLGHLGARGAGQNHATAGLREGQSTPHIGRQRIRESTSGFCLRVVLCSRAECVGTSATQDAVVKFKQALQYHFAIELTLCSPARVRPKACAQFLIGC